MKGKQKKTDSFFIRNVFPRIDDNIEDEVQVVPGIINAGIEEHPILLAINVLEEYPTFSRVNNPSFALIEQDPGLRKPMWTFPSDKRDEIRRAYLRDGPLQVKLPKFPRTGDPNHPRGFQLAWYSEFPWLEYSEVKDAAYCLPCYLFAKKPVARSGWDTFVNEGFQNWKKVKSGVTCSFRKHMVENSNSNHNDAVRKRDALLYQSQHIDKVIEKQSSEEVKKNRLRVKTSIDYARRLALQGAAFRGHDETLHSKNHGNFIELVDILSSYNEEVKCVVLGNAPKNAKYTSPDIQKKILHVLTKKVRSKFFEEIGDSNFSIIVDEACDESKHEQMAIILRFVGAQGLIQERFFDVVLVSDTTSMTLHISICLTLSSHKCVVQNLRGQGYDGASNMCGEWKGLQALFLKDHPQAYYVHCMAHHLQLSLVAAAKDVSIVHPQAYYLQQKSQDIVNVMRLVEVTKLVLKEMRDESWDSFLAKVMKFCKDHGIAIPDFSASRFEGRPCRQVDNITNEHHYHFDIFNATIDVQIEELRSRFEKKVVELLKLSLTLDLTDGYKAFNIDAICSLARKYYPLIFLEKELERLSFKLKIFHVDALSHPTLMKLSSVAELCRGLAESGKRKEFDLVDRLIRLVFTLPVSTASGERAFSAMKLVKTKLCNKMNDDFLADSLVIYIERDIVDTLV